MSTELNGRLRRLPEPRKILSRRNDTGGPHQENKFLRTDIYWFGVLRYTLFFCKILKKMYVCAHRDVHMCVGA